MRVVHPTQTHCEMTWMVMPGQTNALGTLFGGQVLAWVDSCAAVSARRFCRSDVVTASIDSVCFLGPIRVGEVVVLDACVNWSGNTSMEVGVRVQAEDGYTGERRNTARAYLTFVALAASGAKIPVPKLEPQTPEDIRRWQDAERRREVRLANRAERDGRSA